MIIDKDLEIIRNEDLEAHFGIEIKRLGYTIEKDEYAGYETGGELKFHCEIKSVNGNNIEQEVYLRIAALDDKDEIIATSSTLSLEPDEFYIEALWSDYFKLNYDKLKALKIYISKTIY